MANSHKLVAAADAHAPATHASTHVSGGTDAVKIDDLAAGDDNTDLNASTTKHGLLLKLDNASTNFLNGQGAWAVPAGSGGAVATDTIWDAAGDLVQGTGANTAAKLSAGAAGQMLQSAGAAAANLWKYPPAYEIDYVEFTSAVNITATVEATPTTIVTGNAIAYDGSTVVMIEFYVPDWYDNVPASLSLILLYDGSTSIGRLGQVRMDINLTGDHRIPILVRRRITPSAATHTYSIRAISGNSAQADGGAGGASTSMPGYIRITKVSGGA